MEPTKATPVHPPVAPEVDVIDVDMTHVYTILGVLSVSTVALSASTAWLWKKTRKNEEYLEAMREYVSRLVNETECGQTAYATLLDEIDTDEPPVDWSEDHSPFPTQETEESV